MTTGPTTATGTAGVRPSGPRGLARALFVQAGAVAVAGIATFLPALSVNGPPWPERGAERTQHALIASPYDPRARRGDRLAVAAAVAPAAELLLPVIGERLHTPPAPAGDLASLIVPDRGRDIAAEALGGGGLMRLIGSADRGERTLAALDRAVHPSGDELIQFGRMRVPRRLVDTVVQASILTDVDPIFMMALADKESSFLPEVRARTSTAEGLYQFIERTWLDMVQAFGPRHGLEVEANLISLVEGRPTVIDPEARGRLLALRRDPYLSAVLAAEMSRRDRERVSGELGRQLSRTELYLLHFLGADAALRFMRLRRDEPQMAAATAFPAAARANRALFYVRDGRRQRSATLEEFYTRLDELIGRRIDRYVGLRTEPPPGEAARALLPDPLLGTLGLMSGSP